MSKERSADSRYDNNIDFLRLLAAISVVFGHAFAFAGGAYDPLTAGFVALHIEHADSIHTLGVWFLFFISGNLVSASYAYRHNLGDFAKSRFLRIYPGLFVVIVVSVIGCAFISTLPIGEFFTNKDTWKYFSRNITGLTVKYSLPGVFTENKLSAVNGSLWTIPLEIRLYMVVAALGLAGLFRKTRILAVILIAAIVMHVILTQTGHAKSSRMLSGPVPVFLCGSLFFCMKDKLPKRLIWFVLLAIVWFPLRSVPYAGHLLMIVTFCYGFHLLTKIKKIKALDVGRYGDYSYGVYLYSAPIQQVLVWKGFHNGWSVFAVSLVLSLVAGALSWHLVEKKALKFKLKTKSPVAAIDATT